MIAEAIFLKNCTYIHLVWYSQHRANLQPAVPYKVLQPLLKSTVSYHTQVTINV